jgi:hypothetical protein
VLGQAKSKAVSLVATRMLRGEKTTLETKRVSARRNRPIVLAILVLALAVSVGIVLLQSRGGDTTAAVAAPRDASTLRVTPIEAGADTTAVVAAPRDASTLRVTPIEADAMPELVAAAPVDAAVRTIHDVTPARSPGKISIESTPYATIYIDGKRLDVTPIVGHTLPAGKHRVRAVLENGRSKELVVDVPAGRTANPIQLTW